MSKKFFVVMAAVTAVVVSVGCKKGETEQTGGTGSVVEQKAAVVEKDDGRMTGPVAKVNGEEIPANGFYEELDKITQGGTRTIPEDRLYKIQENILRRMTEQVLLDQEIARQKVTVTAEELENQFNKYKARFKGEEQFQSYLSHGKTSVEEINNRLSNSFALTKLLTSLGKLDVTDAAVEQAYKTGIKMYTEPEQVHALHILIKVFEKADDAKVAEAKKKVDNVFARIKKGEDFALIAKEMSEDAMSKAKDGDLGYFRKGVMVPAFEKAAFDLKVGTYTKTAVRTPFGFHIIKVLDHKPEVVQPLEEVREKIVESLKNRNLFKARREMLDSLKATATIESFLPEPPAGKEDTPDKVKEAKPVTEETK